MNNSTLNKIMISIADLSVAHLALFAMLVTAGTYFLVYDDGSVLEQNLMSVQASLEAENAKKIETQKIIKKEEQMRSDVQVFAQRFEEIKAKIPIELTESELRSTIDRIVQESQLRTLRSERSSYTNNVNSGGNAVDASKLVEMITLNYTLQGSYAQISNFVKSLTNQEKLIKLADFNMNRVKPFSDYTGKRDPQIDDLHFSVNIVGYKQSLDSINNTNKGETK